MCVELGHVEHFILVNISNRGNALLQNKIENKNSDGHNICRTSVSAAGLGLFKDTCLHLKGSRTECGNLLNGGATKQNQCLHCSDPEIIEMQPFYDLVTTNISSFSSAGRVKCKLCSFLQDLCQ